MKGMTPDQVDLAMALKLLTLPREISENIRKMARPLPLSTAALDRISSAARKLPAACRVVAAGCYFRASDRTAQATQSLAAWFRRKREPLKLFDASPVTGEKVQLLDGRYGMYVTDGTTNATVPKQTRQRKSRSKWPCNSSKTAPQDRRKRSRREKRKPLAERWLRNSDFENPFHGNFSSAARFSSASRYRIRRRMAAAMRDGD